MKFFLILIIFLSANARALSVINKADIPILDREEIVLYKEKVEGNSWPRLKINLLINSSPLEAIAIYLALDHQKNYLPDLLESKPIRHVTATEVITEYELELPWPLSNSHYTHGSNFKKLKDGSYKANWYMVKSDSAHAVDGSAHFSEYKGKTLMQYEILIRPKSALSGIVRGFMIKNTKASMMAIKTEIERSKKSDQKLLKMYISYIQRSLQGQNVYKLD